MRDQYRNRHAWMCARVSDVLAPCACPSVARMDDVRECTNHSHAFLPLLFCQKKREMKARQQHEGAHSRVLREEAERGMAVSSTNTRAFTSYRFLFRPFPFHCLVLFSLSLSSYGFWWFCVHVCMYACMRVFCLSPFSFWLRDVCASHGELRHIRRGRA